MTKWESINNAGDLTGGSLESCFDVGRDMRIELRARMKLFIWIRINDYENFIKDPVERIFHV